MGQSADPFFMSYGEAEKKQDTTVSHPRFRHILHNHLTHNKIQISKERQKNLLQTIFQSPANDFSFGAEQKIICRKVNPTTPRDMISFDKALLPKSGTPTHGMHFAALPVRGILQKK